jgi:hypothetical protein
VKVIIAVPAVDPVTITVLPAPVIDAFVLFRLHVPPAEVSLIVTAAPVHKVGGACIGRGEIPTVTDVAVCHPLAVYVMVAVPVYTELALTTPVPATTEAINALLLLQVPPVVLLLSVSVPPWHIDVAPVIADAAPIFTMLVVKQPEASV